MSDTTPIGRVIVTGGASGLGAAVAAAVAEAGGTPVVIDRRLPAEPPYESHEGDVAHTREVEASGGRVVTVASTLALRALPDATAYCAAKFGVLGFSRALAAETGGRVGVTTLLPGGMRTRFFDDREERYRPGADARLNDPADVAAAVVFALSRPAGVELRELLVCPAEESSWP